MTNTLTDRERELVEAAQKLLDWANRGMIPVHRTFAALRAYDPPKVKKYTMPSWEELWRSANSGGTDVDGQRFILAASGTIHEKQYNAIREALATEE